MDLKTIKEQLKEWFEREYSDVSETEKSFRIQYTIFELDDFYKNEVIWEMKGFIPYTRQEAIYDSVYVDYDSTSTRVKMTSRKGNYDDDIYLEDLVDGRGLSNDTIIYLIDLYPEYKPRHFRGSCWTRGAWMLIRFEDNEFVSRDPWDTCFNK